MNAQVKQSGRVGVQTKFLGPTNFKGARIKAYTETRLSITVPWEHGQSVEENHNRAALALIRRLGWDGQFIGGASGDGKGFTYINVR